MKATPVILGACVVGAMGGAVAGLSLDTTPIQPQIPDPLAAIPDHPIALAKSQRLQQANLPEHYPLETPEGTIEVRDLAYWGRLRNRVHPDYYVDPRFDAQEPQFVHAVHEEYPEERLAPDRYLVAESEPIPAAERHERVVYIEAPRIPHYEALERAAAREEQRRKARQAATTLAPRAAASQNAEPKLARASETQDGGPKVINVSAALAARN